MRPHIDPSSMSYVDCDTCWKKPGAVDLCSGCLHNRSVIEKLLNRDTEIEVRFKEVCDGHNWEIGRIMFENTDEETIYTICSFCGLVQKLTHED